jgi:DNA-directed RNA polymerase specialized sigma24 family protein
MADTVRAKRAGTEHELSALIASLAVDPAEAGARYERLRSRLILFFSVRALPMADMLADEAIDRLSRRIAQGQAVDSIEAYLLGIARLIAMEEGRRERNRVVLENRTLWNISHPSDTSIEEEERITAIEGCLRKLAHEDREFLQRYYTGDHADRINVRRSLAQRLELSPGALRKRAFRLRAMVEACARGKLAPKLNPGQQKRIT